MDSFVAISLLDSCSGWLGALTLIVVGGVVARQADATAGLVVAGAGGLKILLNCCLLAPNLAVQLGDVQLDESVFTTNLVLVQLQRLLFFGLLAVAITRLSRGEDERS